MPASSRRLSEPSRQRRPSWWQVLAKKKRSARVAWVGRRAIVKRTRLATQRMGESSQHLSIAIVTRRIVMIMRRFHRAMSWPTRARARLFRIRSINNLLLYTYRIFLFFFLIWFSLVLFSFAAYSKYLRFLYNFIQYITVDIIEKNQMHV